MKINGNPDGGGGKSAVIESLSVTSNGTYTADAGVDGYSPVEVSVPEQKPEETFNVTPSTTEQTITPQEGYVFTSGVVGAVTSNIDANIQAGNIKSGVSILGVEGNYTAPALVTESLSVSVNGTYNPGQGVDGFSQVVVDVPQSVTGFTEKEITEANIQIVNLNNSASYVASFAFQSKSLQTVYLPDCISVGAWAFAECKSLTSVYLPNCTTFSGSYQFGMDSSMSQIYVPLLKGVPQSAFNSCHSLESIDLPEATYIYENAFFQCSSLSQINIPKVSTISIDAFSGCISLKSFYAPECLIMSALVFNVCSGLETVDFPVLYKISGEFAFNSCHKLVSVSLPLLYDITSACTFYNCSSLSEIELPLLYRFNSNNTFTNCSSLERLTMPLWYSNTYYSNYRDQGLGTCSRLSEVTIGTGLYIVPSYLSLGSYFIANNGIINIDAEMYDKWLSHSQWGSMSAHFRSYVSTNSDPLLSVSDGVLYGRTKMLIQGTSTVDWKSHVTGANTVVNVSLPECEVIGDVFRYASSVRTIYLPKLKLIPYQIDMNYSMTSIYFGELEEMYTIKTLDRHCSVTIATSKVCKCLSTNAFWDYVPDSIYVPASLVDAYKSAPVWSSISTHIFPIPE